MATNAWATDLATDVDLDRCCLASSIGGRAHCACWYPARVLTVRHGPPIGQQGPTWSAAAGHAPVGIHEATHWRHPAGYTRPIPAPLATAREAA